MARAVIPNQSVPVVDPSTGRMHPVWYNFFADLVRVSPGWAAATGTATRTTFATGSVTLPQLAERVKALIDDDISRGLKGA